MSVELGKQIEEALLRAYPQNAHDLAQVVVASVYDTLDELEEMIERKIVVMHGFDPRGMALFWLWDQYEERHML